MNQKLVIIGGVLASGKTTVAKKLVELTGFRYVAVDRIKEALFDVGGWRDRAWSKKIGEISFPVFQSLIEMHLNRGDSVIAESTFLYSEDKEWIEKYTKRYNLDLIQLWMTIDPNIVRKRFCKRANSDRHCGHCDDICDVQEEFEERFFNRSWPIPLCSTDRTMIIDTTDWNKVDHDRICKFVTSNSVRLESRFTLRNSL